MNYFFTILGMNYEVSAYDFVGYYMVRMDIFRVMLTI